MLKLKINQSPYNPNQPAHNVLFDLQCLTDIHYSEIIEVSFGDDC